MNPAKSPASESGHELLVRRLQQRMTDAGLSQRALALQAGLNATAVRDILNGRSRNPHHGTLKALATVLRCRVEDLTEDLPHRPALFAPGLAEPVPSVASLGDAAEIVAIPVLDARLSAGAGGHGSDEVVDHATFQRAWLRRLTGSPPEYLAIAEVDSDSMEPTLRSGDQVLVDTLQRAPNSRDGIYALRRDGGLQVKRLSVGFRTGLLTVASDNPLYGDEPNVELRSLEIVGRVIWLGRRI